mgnify:CR=1 FL=1
MIRNIIKSIRNKPEHVRDNIALVSSFVFALMIGGVWLWHVPAKISSVASGITADGEERSFFSVFKDITSELGNLKSTVEEIKTDLSAEETGTASTSESEEFDLGSMVDQAIEDPSSVYNAELDVKPAPNAVRIVAVPSASSTAETAEATE